MLFIGEKVGGAPGKGPKIDIALDPLEGTTITAKAGPNALAVLAAAAEGCLLNAPDVYMDKLAVGPGYPDGIIDLAKTPTENVEAVAKAKGVAPADIIVCVLDRPRHAAPPKACWLLRRCAASAGSSTVASSSAPMTSGPAPPSGGSTISTASTPATIW